MAVIISTNDPIPTNTAPQASNDTSWMQDLVVETKPEIIAEPTPAEQKIETPVVMQETIQNSKIIEKNTPLEVTPRTPEETKKDPIITNIYIAADQAKNQPA